MTIQDLINLCNEKGISLDTQIALRAKDDYLLTESSISLDIAYFGNCQAGSKWEDENLPRDENGDKDYDKAPEILILDTGRG
jgi:hypothetical protein